MNLSGMTVCILIFSILSALPAAAEETAVLVQRLKSKNKVEVITAVRQLGGMPGSEAAAALAAQLQNEKDSYIKIQIIESLALGKSEAAVPALLAALSDPNTQVRQAAIDNLSAFCDDPKTVAALRQTAEKEQSKEVTLHVINTLSCNRNALSVQAIDGLGRKGADTDIRSSAVRALRRINTAEARSKLAAFGPEAAALDKPSKKAPATKNTRKQTPTDKKR